jgi:hypothetical protein
MDGSALERSLGCLGRQRGGVSHSRSRMTGRWRRREYGEFWIEHWDWGAFAYGDVVYCATVPVCHCPGGCPPLRGKQSSTPAVCRHGERARMNERRRSRVDVEELRVQPSVRTETGLRPASMRRGPGSGRSEMAGRSLSDALQGRPRARIYPASLSGTVLDTSQDSG